MKSIAGWEDNRETSNRRRLKSARLARPSKNDARARPKPPRRNRPRCTAPTCATCRRSRASSAEDGWVDMQVQFLIDKKSAGADHVVGWTVLQARRAPRKPSPSQLRRVLHRAQGQGPHLHRERRASRRAKAMWSIRRAAAGTASTTPRTKTSCWSGAGWAPARSRRPATKSIRRRIKRDEPADTPTNRE